MADVEWRGTGGLYLKYLLEERYHLPITLVNAMAAGGIAEDSAACIGAGINYPYMFSIAHNRLFWHHTCQHNSLRCMLVELLFMNGQPPFQQFALDEQGHPQLLFAGPETKNHESARQIQKGILDFCDLYHRISSGSSCFAVSGVDAASPMDRIWMPPPINTGCLKAMSSRSWPAS